MGTYITGVYGFKGSGFSLAAGQKNSRSNRKRNFGLMKLQKDAEKANIEYRIMNIECRRNAFYRFL